MKPQPLDLEELEKTILSYFDREKERLLKKEQEKFILKPDLSDYYAGKKEECSVMKEIIRTHLKREIKQRLKSACELYLQYKDNPELFVKELPEYREEVDKIWYKYKQLKPSLHSAKEDFMREYNDWLFHLVFKSVLEDDK